MLTITFWILEQICRSNSLILCEWKAQSIQVNIRLLLPIDTLFGMDMIIDVDGCACDCDDGGGGGWIDVWGTDVTAV